MIVCLLFFFHQQPTHALCREAAGAGVAGDISPTLEIDVLEYKDEYVLPTGYGATIICRSNCLKLRCSMNEKPYQITLLFNGTLAKSCSGGNLQKTCSYFIQNTAEGNSGDYTCKTYNQYGCTMDTLRLVFKAEPSPPRFLVKNPRQLIVPIRGNATLTCSATGIPLPVIRWYKNGHPVPRSSATEFKGHSQLELQAVGLRDQGKCWCEANSTEGWDRTSPTTLKVLWKPVFFIHPHRYIAHLNRDGFAAVTLSCEARGFPTPVISWLQDKTLLKSDSTVTQNGDTSSLTVVFTTETEQPLKYRCLANNPMGKTWSKEGEVTIIASAQRKIPVSDDNSSSSLGVSKAVGISIPIGSAFLIINAVLIAVLYKKCRKPTTENIQMDRAQRFPNLHARASAMGTRREEPTTLRYQKREMAEMTRRSQSLESDVQNGDDNENLTQRC